MRSDRPMETDEAQEIAQTQEAATEIAEVKGFEDCPQVDNERVRRELTENYEPWEVDRSAIKSIEYKDRPDPEAGVSDRAVGCTFSRVTKDGQFLDSNIEVYKHRQSSAFSGCPEVGAEADAREIECTVQHTIGHEVGHSVYQRADPELREYWEQQIDPGNKENPITDYSTTSPEEHFAESYGFSKAEGGVDHQGPDGKLYNHLRDADSGRQYELRRSTAIEHFRDNVRDGTPLPESATDPDPEAPYRTEELA